jgi:hypothetical protein
VRLHSLTTVLLVAALAGCASEADQRRGGHLAVGYATTPVYVVLKAPICATSVVMAAAVGSLAMLAPSRREKTMRDLGDGVGHNCGPPWTAIPQDREAPWLTTRWQ